MAVLQSFLRHAVRTAVADSHGHFSYAQLLSSAVALRDVILSQTHLRREGAGSHPRVAYLVPRDHRYVVCKCAAWLAGCIGVPLAESNPKEEIKYTLTDSGATCILAAAGFRDDVIRTAAAELGIPVVDVAPLLPGAPSLPSPVLQAAVETCAGVVHPSTGAFLIYTSGTTGRPKGVLTTHGMLHAQTSAMSAAWGWSAEDRIYSVLPLHHVHGIVAVVLTGLASGACVEFAPKFDALACWRTLTRPAPPTDATAQADPTAYAPTLFMAVPTVYSKMLEAYGKAGAGGGGGGGGDAAAWSAALQSPASAVRLMVSGSAALPESVARAWRERTGHTLLERYGMTEFAMAVSNPVAGERRANTVGQPLPGYEARLVPEGEGGESRAEGGGELQVRGPGVFTTYWGRPEESKASFTSDGWFITGDRAVVSPDGYISIQGRLSADILKCGGYKLSALDIERELLEHEGVGEVAVLGLPDETWGEKVAAVVVLRPGSALAGSTPPPTDKDVLEALRDFAASRMAPYKLPTVARVLPEMPRNAMGKVNKKALRKEVFGV